MIKLNNTRSSKDLLRKNEHIRASQVRLVDSDGTMLGIVSLQEALRVAKDKELDLVEISPTAQPPVCKVLDYSKYVYEQGKKNKDAKKKLYAVSLKEIRLKSRIAAHDLEVKVRQIESFLKKKDMVRVCVVFYGRENQHKDIGITMLEDMKIRLAPFGDVEGAMQTLGNRISITFVPKN